MLFLVNLLKKHKRRAVFTVFCSSLTSETLFFPFFAFRLRAKASFLCFLSVACKRNAVFRVFCISLASDEQLLYFFFCSTPQQHHFFHWNMQRGEEQNGLLYLNNP